MHVTYQHSKHFSDNLLKNKAWILEWRWIAKFLCCKGSAITDLTISSPLLVISSRHWSLFTRSFLAGRYGHETTFTLPLSAKGVAYETIYIKSLHFLCIPTPAGITVQNATTNVNLPPVVNRTDSDCFYSCSFNDRSSSEYIEWIGSFQPCVYTLEVMRVFKGNYKVRLPSFSPIHSSLHMHVCWHAFACLSSIEA